MIKQTYLSLQLSLQLHGCLSHVHIKLWFIFIQPLISFLGWLPFPNVQKTLWRWGWNNERFVLFWSETSRSKTNIWDTTITKHYTPPKIEQANSSMMGLNLPQKICLGSKRSATFRASSWLRKGGGETKNLKLCAKQQQISRVQWNKPINILNDIL